MKTVLRLEELAMALLCLFVLYHMEAQWWWYLLFLLGPDISFLGYLFGNKTGAIAYNLFHHKAIAILLLLIFFLLPMEGDREPYLLIGVVLLGHSSMDRFFGYGLKHFDGFKFTHLGEIGKK
jgi:hypothetical protein